MNNVTQIKKTAKMLLKNTFGKSRTSPFNALLFTALLLTVQPFVFGSALTETAAGSIGDTLGNKQIPNWSGGALITEEGLGTTTPFFISYDRRGNVLGSVPFSIPGATYLSLVDFSRAADGMVAVCGSATDAEGRTAPFVAWVDPGSRKSVVVRTAPYHPRKVTVDADGTIWTVGFESMPNQPNTANSAGFIFKKWDRSGQLAGSYLTQSQLKDARNVYAADFLRSSRGRVAWFSSREGRYIEVSLSGTIIKAAEVQLPNPKIHISGMALADSGEVILSTDYNGTWAVMRLDSADNRWVEIESGTSNPVLVYGSDGDLIVARRGGTTGDFKFFQLPKE
jgi:hypothetical protein